MKRNWERSFGRLRVPRSVFRVPRSTFEGFEGFEEFEEFGGMNG